MLFAPAQARLGISAPPGCQASTRLAHTNARLCSEVELIVRSARHLREKLGIDFATSFRLRRTRGEE